MRYQLCYCKSQPVSVWFRPDALSRMVAFARRLSRCGYGVSIWKHTTSGASLFLDLDLEVS